MDWLFLICEVEKSIGKSEIAIDAGGLVCIIDFDVELGVAIRVEDVDIANWGEESEQSLRSQVGVAFLNALAFEIALFEIDCQWIHCL